MSEHDREECSLVMLGEHIDEYPLNPEKEYFFSEKLDGYRIIYDARTKGMLSTRVSYANVAKDRRILMSTGIWSRGGKALQASPDWLDYLRHLPEGYIYDGEAYMGRKQSHRLGLVRALDADWSPVTFHIFDIIPYREWDNGRVIKPWFAKVDGPVDETGIRMPFYQRLAWMKANIEENKAVKLVEQRLDVEDPEQWAQEIAADDGEGVMAKEWSSVYEFCRSPSIIKIKPLRYGTATVIGYKEGKGRNLGRLGSYDLRDNSTGVCWNIGNISDAERNRPRSVGSILRYRYRELTPDGKPKESQIEE